MNTKNNLNFYKISFFIILILPLLNLPPWFYPPDWGKSVIFRSILSILLFLFIFQILSKKNNFDFKSLLKDKIILSLFTLFLIYFLASIFSVDALFSFWGSPYRGGGFINFGFYFIFALFLFIILKENKDWKNAWIVSISTGIIVCAIALIQFYGFFSKIFITMKAQPISTIGNPIFLGIYLLLLLFPCASFFITETNKKTKIFYGLSVLLFLYTILIAASRAVYLGTIVAGTYFLLFYPKKFKKLKIITASFLILIFSVVIFANVFTVPPKIISKNKTIEFLYNRLSIKSALNNERYLAWEIVAKEIKDKPILGWGPENLSVGFDKFYDPKIVWSSWWDKAHNIFLDMGAETGILGIFAYIFLFFSLFWQLFKIKKETNDENKKIIINGLQAVLIGYLVANLFSFDSFSSYLIFFFIIAYVLYLTFCEKPISEIKNLKQPSLKFKKLILTFSFLALIIFLWQYNFVPFQINTQINKAENLAKNQKCEKAFVIFEENLTKNSILNSYFKTQYVDSIKKCSEVSQDKNYEYGKKGVELLEQVVKIRPLYTRYWIYLGAFQTVVANNEQNSEKKADLLKKAYSCLNEAEKLSPFRTEIFIEKSKLNMVAGDYYKMKQDAEKCININPNLGSCYWEKSLSEIYLKEIENSENDKKIAKEKGFDVSSLPALYQLLDVYINTEQYEKLVEVYKEIILQRPTVAQYRASLALAYSKIGEYKKARDEALIFLQLMPEAEAEVNEFLKTLPY